MDLRLLDRYFTGSNCSPAELQEIKQYLEHPDHLLEEYLSGEWRQAGGLVNEDRKQKNLRRIMAATAQLPVQEIRPRRWKGYWAAAAILGIVLLGSLIINKNRIDHTSTIVASKITWKTMRNGSDNVQLITLPEGSRVWLNSRTAISYPADYGARNKREIHLSGEAYFDVMHDARRPFIIHTDSLQTTVLGTSFAIRAWPHTPYIQVALVKGSVRVTGYNGTLKETLVPGD
ncbi:FecR family protein, partial [uncultured Chitinophaga sp.]|uniref:FecR family protein n=1 Tax=uncultured Chitinophaga sp. TaxID=339340 RepID=UPI0025CD9E1E